MATAATIFIINESIKTFQDYLAAIFGILFSLMFIRLIWSATNIRKTYLLRYRYFCTLSLCIISSIILFILTLLLQGIQSNFLQKEYLIYAPLGTGAVSALCIGYIISGRILPKSLPFIDNYKEKSNYRLVAEVIVASLITGYIIYYLRILAIMNTDSGDCEHLFIPRIRLCLFLPQVFTMRQQWRISFASILLLI